MSAGSRLVQNKIGLSGWSSNGLQGKMSVQKLCRSQRIDLIRPTYIERSVRKFCVKPRAAIPILYLVEWEIPCVARRKSLPAGWSSCNSDRPYFAVKTRNPPLHTRTLVFQLAPAPGHVVYGACVMTWRMSDRPVFRRDYTFYTRTK